MTGKRGIKPIASEPVKALAIMDDSRLGKARLPVRDADSGTSLGDEGGMPFGGEDGEGICLSFCHRAGERCFGLAQHRKLVVVVRLGIWPRNARTHSNGSTLP